MKRILIAPLDWGLGHATRCIPIIKYLIEKGCEVVIGGDGRPMHLLQNELACKGATFLTIPGYDISYPGNGSMTLQMVSQIPKILSGIKCEHGYLKEIIREKNIDAVISDNRFGLWSREVPCVFMTHQLMVKSFFGEKLIHELNKNYISKYSECWVPDSADNHLSGDLANKFPLPENAKFIGILSRFLAEEHLAETLYDLMIILSGPEPQRTVFERMVLDQLRDIPPHPPSKGELKVLIVQGITEKKERRKISRNVEMVSHLTTEEIQKAILSSKIVLSRPGYSTVMDLAALGRKAIFVPTPGQTEQEYLAEYYTERKIAYSVSQKSFDLTIALRESEKYSGFTQKYSGIKFNKAVDEFLIRISS